MRPIRCCCDDNFTSADSAPALAHIAKQVAGRWKIHLSILLFVIICPLARGLDFLGRSQIDASADYGYPTIYADGSTLSSNLSANAAIASSVV